MERPRWITRLVCLLLAAQATWAWAETAPVTRTRPRQVYPTAAQPYIYNRVHNVGNIGFNITNYGFFGSQARAVRAYSRQRSGVRWAERMRTS